MNCPIKLNEKGNGLILVMVLAALIPIVANYFSGISVNAVKESVSVRNRAEALDLEKYIRNNMSCFSTQSNANGSDFFLYGRDENLLFDRYQSIYSKFSGWIIHVNDYDSKERTFDVRVASVRSPNKWIRIFKDEPLKCN